MRSPPYAGAGLCAAGRVDPERRNPRRVRSNVSSEPKKRGLAPFARPRLPSCLAPFALPFALRHGTGLIRPMLVLAALAVSVRLLLDQAG